MSIITRRIIEIHIVLTQGTFNGSDNVKIVRGLATDVVIEKGGSPFKNTCRVTLYNLKSTDASEVSFLTFINNKVGQNLIKVFVGDDITGLSMVFSGSITSATENYQSFPDVALVIEAMTGAFESVKPSAPVSYQGTSSLEGVFKDLSIEMGFAFENLGVMQTVSNQALEGSAMDKAVSLARSNKVLLWFDDDTMKIAPSNFLGYGIPVIINGDTGLIGWVSFNQTGIVVNVLFNPLIQLGSLIQIDKSEIARVNGVWAVNGMSTHLQAYDPSKSEWVTKITGLYRGI